MGRHLGIGDSEYGKDALKKIDTASAGSGSLALRRPSRFMYTLFRLFSRKYGINLAYSTLNT